jgi:hypothetical protein
MGTTVRAVAENRHARSARRVIGERALLGLAARDGLVDDDVAAVGEQLVGARQEPVDVDADRTMAS